MITEFEVAFIGINKGEVREEIKNLGWICTKKETLMKRVIYEKWENSYARIRDEWDKITCTYKEIWDWTLDINSVKELETEVWDFEVMKSIFDKMELRRKSYQENKRETWKINWEVEMMIDTWPWLNPFIEIEWENEEVVKKYSKLLWFDYNNWVFGTVDEIYLKEHWMSKKFINSLWEITFKNPPKIINYVSNDFKNYPNLMLWTILDWLNSKDGNIRNWFALDFIDTIEWVREILKKQILDKNNFKNHWTLVYALKYTNCFYDFIFLFRLLTFKNYEAFITSYMILEEQNFYISEKEKKEASEIFDYFLKNRNNKWFSEDELKERIGVINSIYNYFINN